MSSTNTWLFDDDINNAVIRQLEKGSSFSLMNKLEVDVTKLLIDTVPCAEMEDL